MATLKLTISDQDGAVFEVLRQDAQGIWRDSADEELGDPQELETLVLPELLHQARRWAAGDGPRRAQPGAAQGRGGGAGRATRSTS